MKLQNKEKRGKRWRREMLFSFQTNVVCSFFILSWEGIICCFLSYEWNKFFEDHVKILFHPHLCHIGIAFSCSFEIPKHLSLSEGTIYWSLCSPWYLSVHDLQFLFHTLKYIGIGSRSRHRLPIRCDLQNFR